MSYQAVLLLLCSVTLVDCKGVNNWCEHPYSYLEDIVWGSDSYSTKEDAEEACMDDDKCFGITYDWRYTLRQGWELKYTSDSRYKSWVPCGGYFRCSTFGLESVHGKFLSAQENGGVEWDRDEYREWEQITFEQWGKDSGFLKSYHGKYLAATERNNLEWNRSQARSWEKFQVYQSGDKVAFKSYHGRYLSAQRNGGAEVNRSQLREWEWFTVYPSDCLNN